MINDQLYAQIIQHVNINDGRLRVYVKLMLSANRTGFENVN